MILDADFRAPDHLVKIAHEISRAGVKLLQVRWKHSPSDRDFLYLVKEIVRASRGLSAVIVNDRADIALVSGADGVHVGENDIPPDKLRTSFSHKLLIGYSCHSIEEVSSIPIIKHVDYLAFGTVFPTSTKKSGTKIQGLQKLKQAAMLSTRPLFAIGGINHENVHSVIETGVHGVACISAVLGAEDPREAAVQFLKILEE